MHVAPGNPAGSPGIADELPLGNLRSGTGSELRHVTVNTDPGTASQHPMVNSDRVSPSAFIAGRNHRAISRRVLR